MNTVFVIIVTYKGKQWYDRSFESLRLSGIPIQTIVIDNASNDDTVDYIKSNYPEVHLIESATNLGFGQANNIGIKYALQENADYVFLLNQDAWIEPNTIEELIELHKKNEEFGILSPIHLNVEKNKIEKGLMQYIADYRLTSVEFINDLYFERLSDLYETQYVNAAAWLLPKKTLKIIGGFDPVFFHYGEDDNYMHRVLYHGFKIGICPKINIVHDTENRVKTNNKSQYSLFKFLLVDCTNINKKGNVEQLIFYYLRKSISNILRFKIQNFKSTFSIMIKFILKRKDIYKSRKTNCKIGINWIKFDS